MLQRSRERSEVTADLTACRRLLRGGSRSFYAASLLLPRELADPATAIYAFCRVADDSVDVAGGSRTHVDALRARLARVYAGAPLPLPPDRALAQVVAEFEIPRVIPEALLEGFEWDVMGRRYETLDALHDYGVRVAGTVGAMLAWLMGVRSRAMLARAIDLGVAMQLTNIARDVGEDAAAGRLYLPLDWMREAGIEPHAWLAAPTHSPALAQVVARLLTAAEARYRSADAGLNALPLRFRIGLRAARALYAEIGTAVAAAGFDAVSARRHVAGARKLVLLARSAMPYRSAGALHDPPVAAALPLLDALDAASGVTPRRVRAGARPTPTVRPAGAQARLIWMLELFAELEQRQRTPS